MNVSTWSRGTWAAVLLAVAFILFMSLTIAFDPGGKNPPVVPKKTASVFVARA